MPKEKGKMAAGWSLHKHSTGNVQEGSNGEGNKNIGGRGGGRPMKICKGTGRGKTGGGKKHSDHPAYERGSLLTKANFKEGSSVQCTPGIR